MGTSFESISSEMFAFSVALASASRMFTLQQLARHPLVSGRSQPVKRTSEFLEPYRASFEVVPWYRNKPYLWRLTQTEKQRRGLQYKNVGASQHTEHWLALGDVWLELVFNGLRPLKWFTEGSEIGRFDVFAVVRDQPYLMEIQLTDLSEREWFAKWKRRTEWLQERKWRDELWAERFSDKIPKLLLVTSHPMKLQIGKTIPEGVIVANTIKELPKVLTEKRA